MSKKVGSIISVIVIILAVWGIASINNGNQSDKGPIKIGVIAPLSGPVAPMGEGIKRSIDLADTSGVAIKYTDDECDTKKAISAYQSLKLDNVKIFYVPCSGSVLALAPLAKENGDLIFTAYSGSSEIRKTGTEVIRFNPDALTVADVMKDYFAKSPDVNYGLLYEKQDYAVSLADTIKQILGDRVKVEEGYLSSNISFKSQLIKFKQANIAGIIYIPVSDKAAQIVLKEMSDLGIQKPIIGEVNLCDYPFKLNDFGLKGTCWKAELDTPGYSKFLKDYKSKYGIESQYPVYDALTFDSAEIVARLAKKFSGEDNYVEKIKAAIIKGQEGKITDFAFESNGEVIGGKYLKQISY